MVVLVAGWRHWLVSFGIRVRLGLDFRFGSHSRSLFLLLDQCATCQSVVDEALESGDKLGLFNNAHVTHAIHVQQRSNDLDRESRDIDAGRHDVVQCQLRSAFRELRRAKWAAT